MSVEEFKQVNKKIESAVVSGYKTVEEAVVKGYKAVESGTVKGYKTIESTVVGAYKSIEDSFVDSFLREDGETVEEAKARINAALDKSNEK